MIWSEIPLSQSFLMRVSYTSIDLSYCFLTRHDESNEEIDKKFLMIWSEIPFPRSFLMRVSYTSIDLSYCFLTRHDSTCNKDKSKKAMKKLIKFFLHGTSHLIELVGGWDDKKYFSLIFKWERNKNKADFTCKSR